MSKNLVAYLVLMLGLVTPVTASAAVVVSEIAWMGTDVENGSFCEWVELANTGTESVSLSGWTLKTGDGAMSVPLSGSIDASGYYLIERATPSACPDPVPGISADVGRSFGSGLSNAGEIVILTSGSGEVERIDASGGWEGVVGGDAERKLTAQRNGDAWVTAAATPRAANATESVVQAGSTSTSSSSSSERVVTNPVATLLIETGGDRTVSVKAHTVYESIVYDSTGRHRRAPQVTWAFGDGGKRTGRSVEHAYREPGEYLVVVRAQEGYSHGTASFIVMADPAAVSIDLVSPQGVTLSNNDTRILDLSKYRLVSGKEQFQIPADTQILPGRRVIFPPEITSISTSTATMELRYPSGEIAFSYPQTASTGAVQPGASETGTLLMRPVEIPAHKEVPNHETTIEAPTQAANTVGVGALRSLVSSLLGALWPQPGTYRTLSRASL